MSRRRTRVLPDPQLDWVWLETGAQPGVLPPAERHRTRCLLCGRPLLGHESRAAGMGPVCRGEVESSARGRASDPQTGDLLGAADDPAAAGPLRP